MRKFSLSAVALFTAIVMFATQFPSVVAAAPESAAQKKVTVAAVAVTKVTINKAEAKIAAGNTLTLSAAVAPSNASDKTIRWSSTNPQIAAVSGGKVTAKAVGNTTIVARGSNGKTASCALTVIKAVPATGIKLNAQNGSLPQFNSLTLKATVLPANATNKAVSYSSTNPKVATVTASGAVKAIAVGKTTISAKTHNGKVTKYSLTVTKAVLPTKIALNRTSLSLATGYSFDLNVSYTPSSTTRRGIYWSSSNTKVATVDAKGVVRAKAVGKTVITAKTLNNISKKISVTVTKPVAASGVTIKQNNTVLSIGKTLKLSPTVAPANATVKKLTWSSANKSIATVDSSGLVKALKVGTVKITAKTHNGKTAVSTIKVVKQTGNDVRQKLNTTLRQWVGVNISYSQSASTQKLNRSNPPRVMDCSAFTSSIYLTALNVNISRSSSSQITHGTKVPITNARNKNWSDLKLGDLVFFDWNGDGRTDHVTIYSGNGKIVHMTYSRSVIKETALTQSGDNYDICAIRRIIQDDGSLIN